MTEVFSAWCKTRLSNSNKSWQHRSGWGAAAAPTAESKDDWLKAIQKELEMGLFRSSLGSRSKRRGSAVLLNHKEAVRCTWRSAFCDSLYTAHFMAGIRRSVSSVLRSQSVFPDEAVSKSIFFKLIISKNWHRQPCVIFCKALPLPTLLGQGFCKVKSDRPGLLFGRRGQGWLCVSSAYLDQGSQTILFRPEPYISERGSLPGCASLYQDHGASLLTGWWANWLTGRPRCLNLFPLMWLYHCSERQAPCSFKRPLCHEAFNSYSLSVLQLLPSCKFHRVFPCVGRASGICFLVEPIVFGLIIFRAQHDLRPKIQNFRSLDKSCS